MPGQSREQSYNCVRALVLCLAILYPGVQGCHRLDDRSIANAERGTLSLVSVESGEIQAVRSQLVRPPLQLESEMIIAAMVPEGTIVEQGDEVVRLEASALARQYRQTTDRLSSLGVQRTGIVANQRARLASLVNVVSTATLSRDQADLQRQKLRFESASRQQDARLAFDRATVDLGEARTKLAAQAGLDSLELAQADLELATAESQASGLRLRLAALSLRAPLPGLVVYRARDDGEARGVKPQVGDIAPPWQPIFEIPDLSAMQVEFPIHEMDRHPYQPGLAFKVRLEAYPETEFTGRIDDIAVLAATPEKDSRARVFLARGQIAPLDDRLRPGMTAIVEVTLGDVEDAVLVPRAAVAEREGTPVVFPAATWPRAQPVLLGGLDAFTVAVVGGLAPGTILVLCPADLPAGSQPLGYARHLRRERS